MLHPKLKAYKHLKGNFGTAWQNQQKEFDNLPAPILLRPTASCCPSKLSGPGIHHRSGFPGVVHIESKKDFCTRDC